MGLRRGTWAALLTLRRANMCESLLASVRWNALFLLRPRRLLATADGSGSKAHARWDHDAHWVGNLAHLLRCSLLPLLACAPPHRPSRIALVGLCAVASVLLMSTANTYLMFSEH